MHMTCRHNVKVIVYSHCLHIMCVHTELFFLMDIIILTAQFMEANNYVTQEIISPPHLGHFLVLSFLSLLLCSSTPLPHKCLFDCPSANSSLVYFLWFLGEAQNALITILAVQGYPKVLVLSVSPEQKRTEGGERQERGRLKKTGGKVREREREIREMQGGRL